MGITCTTPKQRLNNFTKEASRIIAHQVTIELQRLGFECERKAKVEATFTDRTGNLRSSIGSAVYAYGREVMTTTFEQVLGGIEGSETGRKYISSLAQLYADTYALVVVAGMDYAEHVERNGYDVISYTELWARSVIEERLKKARKRAEKQIMKLL